MSARWWRQQVYSFRSRVTSSHFKAKVRVIIFFNLPFKFLNLEFHDFLPARGLPVSQRAPSRVVPSRTPSSASTKRIARIRLNQVHSALKGRLLRDPDEDAGRLATPMRLLGLLWVWPALADSLSRRFPVTPRPSLYWPGSQDLANVWDWVFFHLCTASKR